MVTFL